MRTFSITGGQFYRPFGHEVLHSSSVRESGVCPRYQILFLASATWASSRFLLNTALSGFNLKAGVFNGSGINAGENDRNKDFIRESRHTSCFRTKSPIDAGLSAYSGKVTSNSKFVYNFDDASATNRYKVDSTATNAGGSFGRTYVGGDLQLYYDLPVLGGFSLKGEYITGQQPGTSGSSANYAPGSTVTPLYLRKFSGWYVMLLQNVGLQNQFIAKYDIYDPNTDVEGANVGVAGSNLTQGDLKYSTIGVGWTYWWDSYLKFTVWYDIVTNESANSAAAGTLSAYRNDIKDNVLTVRMQYKF